MTVSWRFIRIGGLAIACLGSAVLLSNGVAAQCLELEGNLDDSISEARELMEQLPPN